MCIGVAPFGGADYFLTCMTDFGAKNCVFKLIGVGLLGVSTQGNKFPCISLQ